MKNTIRYLFKPLVMLISMYAIIATADPDLPQGIIALDGNPAPALTLNNMDGGAFNLADVRGRWAFVHFWASWCGPCRREMPTIQSMAGQFSDTTLEIVMVNTAETDDTVFSFMGIVAPDLTPLMDYDGLVTEAWQPRGLPSTYLVDPEGRLRYLALGGRAWDTPPYIRFLKKVLAK